MALHQAGPQRRFTGESLREIAFPLGGIGTGMVSLGGRGDLRDWEIFNRPGKGKDLPYTFFALYAEAEGEPGVARVLERRLMPPYSAGFGLPTGKVAGLPRLQEATFRGEYPFAWLDFADDALPVAVHLEAYNPFIPMNEADSGLPVAIFRWTLTNLTEQTVRATVAFSLYNAVGYNGRDNLSNRYHSAFGKNWNEWRDAEGIRGLFMTGEKPAPDSPSAGTLALATDWPDTTFKVRWERAGWWDDVQNFWDEFTQGRGMLPNSRDTDASPDGQTDVGTLGLRVTLAPGESATLPFTLAWRFPNLVNDWNREETVRGKRLGNWYATPWSDAWDAARYAIRNQARLRVETAAYHQAMFDSTLPAVVLDAAANNASILRTPTVLRTEDGRMNAFEGCGDNDGCCPMNCTHVWNYVQTAAYLFPALERSVRLTDFQHNTVQSGAMAFRTLLPLIETRWQFKPAADGQMGTVMKAYREWLQCGDVGFLKGLWPSIQRAVEFAWSPGGWDADKDGVMEGEQHNTYDIEFYGPNTMMGTFYLGALRAASEMARALGDTAKAEEYEAVYAGGRRKYAAQLWNGEYFKQIVVPPAAPEATQGVTETLPASLQPGESEPRYQYGPGCLADQLLGQWFACVVGLGDLLPQEWVQSALAAIFRHNWKSDLSAHASVQRVYALNDEAGLLLCTWPEGGRPRYPFPYADEVWTGIEYQVAAHCLYEGLIEEGLAIVQGARDRHDGVKRNPWDECECGHHYARAMSSWSLLLALSGYHYDAHRQHLAFAPKLSPESFRSFFSAGTAWGQFAQETDVDTYAATLTPFWGALSLQTLALPLGRHTHVEVSVGGEAVMASLNEHGAIAFAEPLTLQANQTLRVDAS